MPATPKAPMPTPAVFALAVISTWASLSSVRTSRLDSSVTWVINAAIESSGTRSAGSPGCHAVARVAGTFRPSVSLVMASPVAEGVSAAA